MVHGRFWEMEIQIKHLKDICSGLHLIPMRWGAGKKDVNIDSKRRWEILRPKSLTAERTKGNVTYVAISDHLFNKWGYERVIKAGDGKVYNSLSEAYAAYEKVLEGYKDLPQ